jgi:hypothetical protein
MNRGEAKYADSRREALLRDRPHLGQSLKCLFAADGAIAEESCLDGDEVLPSYIAFTFWYFSSAFSKPSPEQASRTFAAAGKTESAKISRSSREKSEST